MERLWTNFDFNAEVKGLHDFPEDERPPVLLTHLSFQVMILIGSFFLAFSVYLVFLKLKGRDIFRPSLLKIFFYSTPLGFVAVEAGWLVTELGRQPWIIYKVMKVKDAVTPMPGIAFSLGFFTLLYIFLGIVVTWLFFRQVRKYQG